MWRNGARKSWEMEYANASSSLLVPSSSVERLASCWFRPRISSSRRLRSLMSLFVSRTAIGLPRSSRCSDHRLETTNSVPSAFVCRTSPSQRPVRGSSARMALTGLLLVVSWRCEDRFQQIMRPSSHCLLGAPAVQLLGAAIPVRDHVVPVADKNAVVCKIEQARLLRGNCHFAL